MSISLDMTLHSMNKCINYAIIITCSYALCILHYIASLVCTHVPVNNWLFLCSVTGISLVLQIIGFTTFPFCSTVLETSASEMFSTLSNCNNKIDIKNHLFPDHVTMHIKKSVGNTYW